METLTEMESYIDEFQFIDNSLSKTGVITLTVHLELCFYFWNGHTSKQRHLLKSCLDEYMELFGEHISWGFAPNNWKQKSIEELPSFQDVLDELKDPDDSIEWFIADKSHILMEEANDYLISCITAREWEIHELSRLKCRIHRKEMYSPKKRNQIIQFFESCIEKLKPYHATMGWATAHGYDKDRAGIDILEQAKDFFGINNNDIWDVDALSKGIRSIDWWTYISHDLSQRVGGIDSFEKQVLDLSIDYKKYSDGILLIASQNPELLPVDEEIPESYIKVNKLVRPMRNGNYGSLGNSFDEGIGYQSFNSYYTDLWIRRFDIPNLWRYLSEEISIPPTKKIEELITNETCQISGLYRYEEHYDYIRNKPIYFEDNNYKSNDYRQYVFLLEGDTAPYFIKMSKNGVFEEKVEIKWTLFQEIET